MMKNLAILTLCLLTCIAMGCDDKSNAENPEPEAPVAKEQAQEEGADEHAQGDKPEGAKGEEAALPEDLADGATEHYGAPFALEGEPITLASALEKATESEGPYKVEARVEKVCKKKGCWFTLASDEVEIPIRVQMKDYGFFVPRNGEGGKAIIEGTLKRKAVPEAMAQHFADDEVEGTDKPAAKIEGDQDTYQFLASGVEITRT